MWKDGPMEDINRRRIELIQKKHSEGLTKPEVGTLEAAEKYLDEKYKRYTEKDWQLLDEASDLILELFKITHGKK